MTDTATPLGEDDLVRLESLLDAVPEPLAPLDVSALDGYLCGVLLQPQRPGPADWLRFITDVDGQALPAGFDASELHTLARRRHAELDRAISERQWFDPWVFQFDEEADPAESVLPWVAGFAAAMEAFPALMDLPDPELVEPLALLYRHFSPEDLEDADALLAVIEELEPPEDLSEAVQDLVRALMLIADVSRPRPGAAQPARRPGPPPRRHGPPQGGRGGQRRR